MSDNYEQVNNSILVWIFCLVITSLHLVHTSVRIVAVSELSSFATAANQLIVV